MNAARTWTTVMQMRHAMICRVCLGLNVHAIRDIRALELSVVMLMNAQEPTTVTLMPIVAISTVHTPVPVRRDTLAMEMNASKLVSTTQSCLRLGLNVKKIYHRGWATGTGENRTNRPELPAYCPVEPEKTARIK